MTCVYCGRIGDAFGAHLITCPLWPAIVKPADLHRAALTRALTAQAWMAMVVWAEFFRLNFPDADLKAITARDLGPNPEMMISPAELAAEILRDTAP